MKTKRNIGLLYAIALLQGMVFYGPIATLYRQAAGVNIAQITLIESISMLLCVLLEVPWGMVADRIGYRRTMIFCCLLYVVSKVVFWKAEGFAGFLLERILLSVVIAGISGVDVSLLYLSCPKEKAQHVFGVYQALSTAGLMIAAGVYALWIGQNYRLAAVLTVCSYAVAALLALGLVEAKPEEERKTKPGGNPFRELYRQFHASPKLLLLVIGAALFGETHQTVTVFFNQLQYTKCGMNDRQIGLVYLLVTGLGLVSGLSASLTRRFGKVGSGAALMLAGAAACLALTVTASAILSILAIMTLRVAYSLFWPLQTEMQNRMIRTTARATALSMNALMMDGISISTNLAFGPLAQAALPLAMALGCAFCLMGAALFWKAAAQE